MLRDTESNEPKEDEMDSMKDYLLISWWKGRAEGFSKAEVLWEMLKGLLGNRVNTITEM